MTVEFTEAVWLEERGTLTLVELAECSGLAEPDLRELVELGVIAPLDPEAEALHFAPKTIVAARTACRLAHDFELDSAGLALALSLIERVRELEADLQRLRARLPQVRP